MKNYEYVCEFHKDRRKEAKEYCDFLNNKGIGKFKIFKYTQSRLIVTKKTKPTTYVIMRRRKDED
ncbi:hypothetical protein [Fusobacterium necrophorum]|uniref:hypothetical protein n=1 Tax=Fusobacterium necrophorum TaxID=859 RepID=UPI00370F1303|nr:hypothetical protein [Fusobacterium necrophorum]